MLKRLCIALVGRGFWVCHVTLWTELWHALQAPKVRGLKRILGLLIQPGDAVLDVGANIGRLTHALARRVGSSGCVHAFEPTPMARRVLEKLVALRRLSQVRVQPCAVGREEGELHLRVPLHEGWKPMHQITHCPGGDAGGDYLDLQVACRQLDVYWEELGRPDISFIKCDTEGHELPVLEGARRLLESCRPSIFCEVEAPYLERQGLHPDQLFQLLRELGYEALRPLEGGHFQLVQGYTGRSNYLFVHPQRVKEPQLRALQS
jgi:FkbM family methyltransferase